MVAACLLLHLLEPASAQFILLLLKEIFTPVHDYLLIVRMQVQNIWQLLTVSSSIQRVNTGPSS